MGASLLPTNRRKLPDIYQESASVLLNNKSNGIKRRKYVIFVICLDYEVTS
jgi:hypothetical protein